MSDGFRNITRKQFLQMSLGAAGAGAAMSFGFPGMAAAQSAQRTRPIPKSGEALPTVGLGTAQSFGYAGTEAEFQARVAVIRTLIEGGGKVIDTSPTYGSAEAVVGRALAQLGMRKQSFIATKISTFGEQDGIDQHRGSVRDLRTPNFDLLQVHNLKDTDLHLKTIRRLREQGWVRYVGITHFRDGAFDRLAKVMRSEPLDFVQLNYSIISRKAEELLLPLARDKGTATIINVPFARGRLFDSVRGRALPPWAVEFDAKSWGQFFLKYLLAHPGVTVVIPGTSKARHMRDNLGAGRGALPNAGHLKRMRQLVEGL